MEEQTKSTAGQGLGIAGFVLGLLAVILSPFNCLGLWPLFLGILGIVLCAIALSQISGTNASNGLIIAGLVLSIIATAITPTRYFVMRALKTTTNEIKIGGDEIKKAFEEEFGKDLDEAREEVAEELKRIARELEGVAEEPEVPEEDSLKTEEEK